MPGKPDFTATRIAGNRYFARWNEMRQQGKPIIILSRSANPNQWQAWRAYYRSRAMWASLDMMDDGRSEKPVPTLDPADFEPLAFVETRFKDE